MSNDKLNQLTGFLSFQPTWVFSQFIQLPHKVICLFTGNQFGKGASVSESYVMRILGIHPIESKNMFPHTKVRTIRFCSQTLPTEGESEVRNTQYPEFRKRLPNGLVKQDVTYRRPVLTLYDPFQQGADINIEFVSYSQQLQAQAGVQRFSIWCDEEPPKEFYEEQVPRLFASQSEGNGGDLVLSLTPAENLTWTFDSFFERARTYVRSKAVRDFILKSTGKDVPAVEERDSTEDIAVIQAATDDNPTMATAVLDANFALLDDPDVVAIRRYGIFKQVSGLIFKDFDPRIHAIDGYKYFPNGVPDGWKFARGIDYHQLNPWACVWAVLSPHNECFIWNEFAPSPERMITYDIVNEMIRRSGEYNYAINLIDPLSAQKQVNTGLSTLDDLNKFFMEAKRNGFGTGGYWQTWDTKGERGRDAVRERLKNAKDCGVPFNNEVRTDGISKYLPTIWFFNTCRDTIQSFRSWRRDDWISRESSLTKDEKDKPQGKFSHFPITVECLFKHIGFGLGMYSGQVVKPRERRYQHFRR